MLSVILTEKKERDFFMRRELITHLSKVDHYFYDKNNITHSNGNILAFNNQNN